MERKRESRLEKDVDNHEIQEQERSQQLEGHARWRGTTWMEAEREPDGNDWLDELHNFVQYGKGKGNNKEK